MKKIIGTLGIAFLGGIIALLGYKTLVEEPQVIVEKQTEPTIETVKANYTPTVVNATSTPTDFTEAADKTVHAVVHVKNTSIRTQQNPWAELFYGSGSGTRKYEQVGTGSGVIISPDGYIVTNNHVIEGANDIEITLNNQKKLKATLIGADENNDIALLKVEADFELPNLPFGNSDYVNVGEWVLAVGNPYNLTSTVTAGIVSAKGRDLTGNKNIDAFIQTDAAVNPGNSGGALVNTRGELIGINTAISSRTGSFIGYSFAVPSNIAKKVVDDLLEFGSVQEAILGINIDVEATDIAGVKIKAVSDESGAKKAGLKEGDIITKINNVKITKFSDLKGQLTAKRPGEFVNVTVDRDGEELVKAVRLTKLVELPISKVLQTEFEDITKEDKRKFKINAGAKIKRTQNLAFKQFEVGEGYILTEVNGKKITSAKEAVNILDKTYGSGKTLYLVMISPSGQLERFRY
ncbi:trypsin-like peptidase domain-containing protein [Tenacibaculum tangerinum]|uniref:Trypsin-like peptidase domain-containing protein n=1 Tax=Tenacibaculum tangerinum TaxID=3038772 RepID=A0ABY8L2Y3_9FLAO|nr:trypsin-like peptidase domain-containing protein [Tenacibaculum tangerinum]WGH75789.1 trypsin-like peptidase domain-containing protein [Tenacibaculum tangerinum]